MGLMEFQQVFGSEANAKNYTALVGCFRTIISLQEVLWNKNANYEETLEKLLKEICTVTKAEHCSLMVITDESLVVEAATRKEIISTERALAEDAHSTKAIKGGKPVILRNQIADDSYLKIKQAKPGFTRSSMLIPLNTPHHDRFGIICLNDKMNGNVHGYFEQSDLNLTSIIVEGIAPALYWFINYEELRKAEENKDELIYAMIHDLKSPVFCMKETFEEVAENVPETFLFDFNLLYHRIVDCIDIHKVRNKLIELNKEFLLVKELLERVIFSLERYMTYYEVQVEITDINPDDGFDGDPEYLFRVLENLLTNAIKHSSPQNGGGGVVTVSCESTFADIAVSVTDSGKGVPDLYKELIFSKHAQPRKVKGSSGLGLSFCKLITEAHGGSIAVTDHEPTGSSFTIRFPFVTKEIPLKKTRLDTPIL